MTNSERSAFPAGRFFACPKVRKSFIFNDLNEHYANIKSLLTIS
ncbi:hypothetical protein [Halomonas nitroreducens]|nr:hypothetical protein [Halomonas nitroreducens]